MRSCHKQSKSTSPSKDKNTLLGDGDQVDGAVGAAAGAAGSWAAQLPPRRADQLPGEVAGPAGIGQGGELLGGRSLTVIERVF